MTDPLKTIADAQNTLDKHLNTAETAVNLAQKAVDGIQALVGDEETINPETGIEDKTVLDKLEDKLTVVKDKIDDLQSAIK